MRHDAATNSLTPLANPSGYGGDPFDDFLNSTMSGTTALVARMRGAWAPGVAETDNYIMLRLDVILQYERTILELRQKLIHYRRLLSQLVEEPNAHEEGLEAGPVVPVDPASVRIVNSILSARVPQSATFQDFDEGEL